VQFLSSSKNLAKLTDVMGHVVMAGSGDDPNFDPADASDALNLVTATRYELHRLEASLLTVARQHGLTWRQIAEALAYDSPQAAQQRYRRLSGGDFAEIDPDATT
jgi:hypothetical protein